MSRGHWSDEPTAAPTAASYEPSGSWKASRTARADVLPSLHNFFYSFIYLFMNLSIYLFICICIYIYVCVCSSETTPSSKKGLFCKRLFVKCDNTVTSKIFGCIWIKSSMSLLLKMFVIICAHTKQRCYKPLKFFEHRRFQTNVSSVKQHWPSSFCMQTWLPFILGFSCLS
jgi:hypothetical protein